MRNESHRRSSARYATTGPGGDGVVNLLPAPVQPTRAGTPLPRPDGPNRPLRVAMVVPPWYEVPPHGYGGIEQVCAALADALVARGHEVTLFGAGSVGGRPRVMPELIHVARLGRLLDPAGFDLVHDHTLAGLLVAGTRPVPTVATVHGSPVGELGEYLDCVDRSVALVAVSHAQRRLRADLPWSATVHCGLSPTEEVRPGPGRGPVVWIGRFTEDEGADLAVRACRTAQLPLVLAGRCVEPAERRYLEEALTPMLYPGVDLVLNPTRERCRDLLWDARCLLMPVRREEPFGVTMVAAMAMGTPVVALDRGAVAEVVQHGETGLVCRDPAELPGALSEVEVLDPAVCAEHVRVLFSADVMARRYERVYRSLVTSDPTRRPRRPAYRQRAAGTRDWRTVDTKDLL
jgi:glycosyltransferase involved in cell wall biosynthesis